MNEIIRDRYIELAEKVISTWVIADYPQSGDGWPDGEDDPDGDVLAYATIVTRRKPHNDTWGGAHDSNSELLIPEILFWNDAGSLVVVRGYPTRYRAVDVEPTKAGYIDGGEIAKKVAVEVVGHWVSGQDGSKPYPCCEAYGATDGWFGKVYAHEENGLKPIVILYRFDSEAGASVTLVPVEYDVRFVGEYKRVGDE